MEKGRIFVFDRVSKKLIEEKIVAGGLMRYLYAQGSSLGGSLATFIARIPLFSILYGKWEGSSSSRRRIAPFIQSHGIIAQDFENKDFKSFNDFFTRHLQKGARPLASSELIAPADGRYLAYDKASEIDQIFAKGQKLSLKELLGDENLSRHYENGPLIIARLAPMDYHRFHFPTSGTPKDPKRIKGPLYSVNPIALRKNINYLTQNKRVVLPFKTDFFGEMVIIAIGATNVGSIQFTYPLNTPARKGDEMGYFALGGSMLIMLIQPGKVSLDPDIVEKTKEGIETLCQMGSSLGKKL